MNKTDVIMEVSKKTGIALNDCEIIMKAFEEVSQDALSNKFKDIKHNKSYVVEGVADKTGLHSDDCEKVINAFEEVFGDALSSKFNFFRKNKKPQ